MKRWYGLAALCLMLAVVGCKSEATTSSGTGSGDDTSSNQTTGTPAGEGEKLAQVSFNVPGMT